VGGVCKCITAKNDNQAKYGRNAQLWRIIVAPSVQSVVVVYMQSECTATHVALLTLLLQTCNGHNVCCSVNNNIPLTIDQ